MAPFYFTAHTVLAVLMLFGNSLTIAAVFKFPVLQTVTNVFTVSMSLSDVMCGFIIPYRCLLKFTRFIATSSDRRIACWTTTIITSTTHGMSLHSLMAIAIDRFIAVFFPLRYVEIMTLTRAYVLIVGLWIYVFLMVFLSVILSNIWPVAKCEIGNLVPPPTYSVTIAGGIWLGLAITLILYTCIFVAARKQARLIYSQEASVVTSAVENENKRRERRITVMMGVVLGALIICWAPFTLMNIVKKRLGEVPRFIEILFQMTIVLLNVNSVLNPLIYGWKNKEFYRAFRKLLGCPEKPFHTTSYPSTDRRN